MKQSEQLDKLAPALSKAQSEMAGAKKDSNNPFFKSKYADLTSVWIACKEALHSNGLSVIQSPVSDETGRIGVTTMLLHTSGQYVQDSYTLGVKKQNDPQADGSSITYARRYALAAFVGVCPVDDDGEKAMSRKSKTGAKPQPEHYARFVEEVDKCKDEDALDNFLVKGLPYAKKVMTVEYYTKAKSYIDQVRNMLVDIANQ